MIYAFIAALAAGVASGFYAAWEIQTGKVLACEMAIERGNQAAELALVVATEKAKQAELKAEQSNKQLEASYEQSINTVNTYFDRLRESKRSTSHSNPVPSCESAGTFEETNPEFAETAYKLEAYANSCRDFVIDNCGIVNGMGQ